MTHDTQTREALVEVMLLAMSEHHSGNAGEARRIVDAQLSALEAAGVRLVPVEATEEMRQAAVDPLIEWGFMKEGLAEALRAAIAASPYAKDTP
jgi:hypothetical protein